MVDTMGRWQVANVVADEWQLASGWWKMTVDFSVWQMLVANSGSVNADWQLVVDK